MLVQDLKDEECKNSKELYSKATVFLDKNNYTNADLEHCIDWLLKSMIDMEKTFQRVKYERDTIHASTSNIKEAYEINLQNNQTLSNEAKGFAYKIWRYNKKKETVNKLVNEIRKSWFNSKKVRELIQEIDEKYPNHDKLLDIDMDEIDAKVEKYMQRPLLFDPKQISEEEFEKLMKNPAT